MLSNPNNNYRHLTEREREDLRNQGEFSWRTYLREIIRKCDALICLIGNDTHNSIGVKYELDVAISLGIKIIPVRIPRTYGAAPEIIRQKRILNWDAEEINNELSRR